jgi:hypothetical protein
LSFRESVCKTNRDVKTSMIKLTTTYNVLVQFILCLTLLCLFPAVSFSQTSQYEESGNWSSVYLTEESTWVATGQSEKSKNGWFAIRFNSLKDCGAEVTYSKPSPPIKDRLPDGPLDRAMELRVDGNDVWVVKKGNAVVRNGLSVDGTKAVYSLSFYVSFEFILELTSGNYLRMFDRGTEATERFSLNGSKVALSRAYSKCKDQIRSRVPETPNSQPSNPPKPPPAQPIQPKLSTPVQSI